MELKKGYKQTELGPIPEDWETIQIGTAVDLLTGFSFPSRGYSRSGVRLLRGSNVKRGTIQWSDEDTKYWPGISADIRKFALDKCDVVVAMDGSLVGRSFAILRSNDVPALLLQRVARLRSSALAQRFLKAWICSDRFTKHCDAVKTITAIPHISPGDIKQFRIAVPPTKAEQDSIAGALSDADALIESLEQLLAKKRHIKQGTIQELLTGKRRLPGFELKPGYKSTEVGAIPFDWDLKPLADLFTFQNGVNADRSAYGHGVPFANVLEVITHPVITEEDMPGSVALPQEVVRAFALRPGDVLFNRTSETQEEVGLSAVYLGSVVAVFGGFVIRAKPRDRDLNSEFMGHMLRSPIARAQITSQGQGAVRANVGQQDLSRIQVALPGREEQASITAVIRCMNRELDVFEERLDKARQIKETMMQELLTGRIRLVDVKTVDDLQC